MVHRVLKRPARKLSRQPEILLPSNRLAPDILTANPRALKRRRIELVSERIVRLNSSICPQLAARFPRLVGVARGEGVG